MYGGGYRGPRGRGGRVQRGRGGFGGQQQDHGQIPLSQAQERMRQNVDDCCAAKRPLQGKLLTKDEPPSIPNYKGGSIGKRYLVSTNYFRVDIDSKTTHPVHYDVAFQEKDTSSSINFDREERVLIMQDIVKFLGLKFWAYDGSSILYAPTTASLDNTTVDYPVIGKNGEPSQSRVPKHRKPLQVIIKKTATLDVGCFCRSPKLPEPKYAVPQEVIQMLDIALRHSASMAADSTLKRNSIFYESANKVASSLGRSGVEVWKGHNQSLKACQGGPMLNLDLAAAAVIKAGPVLGYIRSEIRGRARDRDILRLLKGLKVKARNRTYKVKGIGPCPDEAVFQIKDRETEKFKEISVMKYFRDCLDIYLHERDLPVLQCGSNKKPTYIPIELAEIVPGQLVRGKLNELQTRDMIKVAAMRPMDRTRFIEDQVRPIIRDSTSQAFGVHVSSDMVEVEARTLPSPSLEYEKDTAYSVGTSGAWNLREIKFRRGCKILSWACISLCDKRMVHIPGPSGIETFLDIMTKKFSEMGMKIPNAPIPLIFADRTESIPTCFGKAVRSAEQTYSARPNIVLVCLANTGKEMYKAIKTESDSQLGIPSQCFVAEKAGVGQGARSRGQFQYIANLAMKINAKLQGVNCKLCPVRDSKCPISSQDFAYMIIGADVTHPQTHSSSDPSVAALVASTDVGACSFACRVEVMPSRTEIITNFGKHVKDLIECFRNVHAGQKPDCIVYFRDGVDQGSFSRVICEEIVEMQKAFTLIDKDYLPPITAIIVQKKHSTRLFPGPRAPSDRSGNVLPGTVVDHTVTSLGGFNFFLVSHAGLQGTSRPTHYHVLLDQCGFGSDLIQLMTYWMTYTFARCSRSVSVVPPIYYAHLAAARAKLLLDASSDDQSSTGSPANDAIINSKLTDSMFYI